MGFFDVDNDIYEEHFEKIYNFTKANLTGDLKVDIRDLELSIESLCTYQGMDWGGRGDLFHAKNSAEIAAIEVLLGELKLKDAE
jgi:hypothetical protein